MYMYCMYHVMPVCARVLIRISSKQYGVSELPQGITCIGNLKTELGYLLHVSWYIVNRNMRNALNRCCETLISSFSVCGVTSVVCL